VDGDNGAMTSTEPGPVPSAVEPRSVSALILGLLFWIVLPVVALLMVITSVATYRDKIDAQPTGTKGTYVATNRSCDGNVCQVIGTFTSDDHTLVKLYVIGDYRWEKGHTYPAVINPESQLIALPALWSPISTIFAGVGGVAGVLIWLGLLITRRPTSSMPKVEPRVTSA
jgi:hypothetical protein